MEPAIFLALALVLVVLGTILVLPFVVYGQGRRIAELKDRLERLEHGTAAGTTVASPPRSSPVAEEVAAAEVVEAVVVEPAAASLPARTLDRETGEGWETWIGRRGLGWVAVILLLFATAFFLKQAFDNRWVGEMGRVALGVVAGLGLCLLGLRYDRKGWRAFSQMLTAGGVVLLYLTTFGAFGYYHLLPQQHAAVFLVVLIAEAAALAVLYEAPAIAIMAVIGGLLTPLLLHSERDQYQNLFLYLSLLNLGVVGLAWFRPWPALGTVALLGTQGLFWAWYSERYHPEKLVWAIGFHAVLFAMHLVYGWVVQRRRRNASVEDVVRMLLNAGCFFVAAVALLYEDYDAWLGTLAIVMAIVYAGLGWISLRTHAEDQRQVMAAITAAMGFVAIALPVQAEVMSQSEAIWIALGWAVQSLVLWWFGCRVSAGALRGLAAVLAVAAVGWLLAVQMPQAHADLFIPLLNQYGLCALAIAGCVLGIAAIGSRFRARLSPPDMWLVWAAGLGALALVWMVISTETYDYFQVQIAHQANAVHVYGYDAVDESGRTLGAVAADAAVGLERSAQTALSVVWAVYAALVLAAGFRLRSAVVRWAALLLFAATLGKVLLVDMAHLPGFYRVAALFALALMMAVAAWSYQKWYFRRLVQEGKGESHDPS